MCACAVTSRRRDHVYSLASASHRHHLHRHVNFPCLHSCKATCARSRAGRTMCLPAPQMGENFIVEKIGGGLQNSWPFANSTGCNTSITITSTTLIWTITELSKFGSLSLKTNNMCEATLSDTDDARLGPARRRRRREPGNQTCAEPRHRPTRRRSHQEHEPHTRTSERLSTRYTGEAEDSLVRAL